MFHAATDGCDGEDTFNCDEKDCADCEETDPGFEDTATGNEDTTEDDFDFEVATEDPEVADLCLELMVDFKEVLLSEADEEVVEVEVLLVVILK